VKVTARWLKSQGKERFARLFKIVFPNGADRELKQWDYRAAVKRCLNLFEVRSDEVLVRCEDCGKHFLIPDSAITNALKTKRTIDCCSCGPSGSMLPVWRRKRK
jgi:hypothetical protein